MPLVDSYQDGLMRPRPPLLPVLPSLRALPSLFLADAWIGGGDCAASTEGQFIWRARHISGSRNGSRGLFFVPVCDKPIDLSWSKMGSTGRNTFSPAWHITCVSLLSPGTWIGLQRRRKVAAALRLKTMACAQRAMTSSLSHPEAGRLPRDWQEWQYPAQPQHREHIH